MFLDEDDFHQELSDGSSDYSPHSRNYTNRTAHKWNRRNSCGDWDPGFVENSSWTNSSFLRSDFNPSSPEVFAVETALRAGCSANGVETVRKLGVGPSDIDAVIDKLGKEDGERLSNQLNKELTSEWKSTSLVHDLGVDDSNWTVGDSLIRTYDLLCNINLQLIVMQRELFKHENNIIKLRSSETGKKSGYDDSQNKAQLRKLTCSLTSASRGLQNRIASLNHVILGVSPVSRITTNLLSTRTLIIACLGILSVCSLIRRFRIFELLKS